MDGEAKRLRGRETSYVKETIVLGISDSAARSYRQRKTYKRRKRWLA